MDVAAEAAAKKAPFLTGPGLFPLHRVRLIYMMRHHRHSPPLPSVATAVLLSSQPESACLHRIPIQGSLRPGMSCMHRLANVLL